MVVLYKYNVKHAHISAEVGLKNDAGRKLAKMA